MAKTERELWNIFWNKLLTSIDLVSFCLKVFDRKLIEKLFTISET